MCHVGAIHIDLEDLGLVFWVIHPRMLTFISVSSGIVVGFGTQLKQYILLIWG